jgi:hypothetical protein
VIPELPEIISGFASCYPKFPNKIRVSGISDSGSGIPGSGFGLRVFFPALTMSTITSHTLSVTCEASSQRCINIASPLSSIGESSTAPAAGAGVGGGDEPPVRPCV